jgi:hypothetical protein
MYPASKHTAAVDDRGVILLAGPIATFTKYDKGRCFLMNGLRKGRKKIRGNKECWSLSNLTEVDDGGAQDFDVGIEFDRVAAYAFYGLVYHCLSDAMATSFSGQQDMNVDICLLKASLDDLSPTYLVLGCRHKILSSLRAASLRTVYERESVTDLCADATDVFTECCNTRWNIVRLLLNLGAFFRRIDNEARTPGVAKVSQSIHRCQEPARLQILKREVGTLNS